MAEIEIDAGGAVVFDKHIVGEFDATSGDLTLNLAWCRLAGLGVVIEGDRTDRRKVLVDRKNA